MEDYGKENYVYVFKAAEKISVDLNEYFSYCNAMGFDFDFSITILEHFVSKNAKKWKEQLKENE